MRLKDFDFGSSSADAEASARPELLLSGFLDHAGVIAQALTGHKFLFLGHKGSGKSALGEHLVLASENNPLMFVRMQNIADLSFQSFSQISQGTIEPEARYPTTWSWLLMLQFFDLFSQDKGSNVESDSELWVAIEALRESGFLPDLDLAKTVRATLESTVTVKLGGILEAGRKTTSRPGSDLPFFVERLKLLVERFQTRSQHILIIDGFDDLLRRRHLQYDALGALIFEALRLNSLFLRKGVPAKLIVLCRTDLYERLPGPNNNKIRQDYSCLLEWCEPGEHSRNSPLIRLINHRAGLRVRGDIDVFRTFLPATVGKGLDIRDHLLAHTRHVPRDIVMLFKFLQEYSGDEPMTEGQIFDALAAYSKRYFVQEIKDELDGQIDAEDITRAFRLLTSVRKRVTRLKELEERAVKLRFPEDFDVESVLRLLFECSAVGNGRIGSTDPQSAVFKFRNRFSSFEEGQYVVAHRALWEGLDLH